MQLKPIRGLSFLLLIFGLVVVLAGTLYGATVALDEDNLDHRLAALADVFSASAVALALIAGLIALLAYNESLKRPALRLDAKLGDGQKGKVVGTALDGSGNYREIADSKDSLLNMTLSVTNQVSARNPAVKVSIRNGLTALHGFGGGWVAGDDSTSGFQSARWDGGADYIVHGGFPRDLYPLVLGRSRLVDKGSATATLRIEWVADGIDKQTTDFVITLQH